MIIHSLGEYLEWVKEIERLRKTRKNVSSEARLLYRGHDNKRYDATPSVFREQPWAKGEDEMLKQLLSIHPSDFEKDQTALERMVRAQHFGLPTRLLDVTRNPLVALFFGCGPCTEKVEQHDGLEVEVEADGEVIAFSPPKSRQKFFDSDTISCLTNLGLLSENQRDAILEHLLATYEETSAEIPEEEEKFEATWIEKFNKGSVHVERLVQRVRQERSGFVPRINPRDLANAFAVVPRILNDRMAAQDGEFMVYGFNLSPDEHFFVDDVELREVHVCAQNKEAILEELSSLAISHERLFPEIGNSALHIKEFFKNRGLHS